MKKIIELTDSELDYLARLVDKDLYGDFETDYECAKCEKILAMLRARIDDKTERSVIEWHDCSSLPDDGEEVLVRYANGHVAIDCVLYDECEDGAQWWHLDNGDASKIVAWAHLPAGAADAEE